MAALDAKTGQTIWSYEPKLDQINKNVLLSHYSRGVADGHSLDIKQAQPVYSDEYASAFELLRSANADAFASIREMVLQFSAQLPGARVVEDSYQSNLAGIALPKGNASRLAYMSEFLARLKRDGSLQGIINSAELRGIDVVAPKAPN